MKFSLILSVIFASLILQSQNLVLNPSFEDFHSSPNALANYNQFVKKWSRATIGSPDYFNSCSEKMNIPETYQGFQNVRFGNGYSGIHTYVKVKNRSYREYIIGSLSETLIKGEKYKVSYYINLADKSKFSIKSIDVLFTQKVFYSSFSSEISEYDRERKQQDGKNNFTFVNINNRKFYSDKEEWIFITQDFVAKGFEEYIIIGNFNDNTDTEIKKVKAFFSKKMAYYYIDMVSVELIENKEYNSTISTPNKRQNEIDSFN